MSWFKDLFKELKCDHEYEFASNIYGDQINYRGGKRSIWKCAKCGKIEYRDKLEPVGNLFTEMLNNNYDEYYKKKYDNWKRENKDTINSIKELLINASNEGKCWLDFRLIIDENKDDRYYWDKTFKNLGLHYERELPDKEVTIYPVDYHLRWKV